MECSPDGLVASEGESDVGDASTDLTARADVLDDLASPDEIHRIVVVLHHASPDRQDVGIKDYVLWIEANLFDKDPIASLADAHLQPKD